MKRLKDRLTPEELEAYIQERRNIALKNLKKIEEKAAQKISEAEKVSGFPENLKK